MELSNFLSNFKQEIINDVATHLGTIQARRKKDKVDSMLAEYCPHCREKKRNCRCNYVASLESQPIPTKFKAIYKNGEVFYIAQQWPWA